MSARAPGAGSARRGVPATVSTLAPTSRCNATAGHRSTGRVIVSKRTADIVIRVLTAVTLVALALAVLFYEDLVGGDGSYPAVALLFAEGDYIEVDSSPRIADTALLILRAALGMMIFVHGYNKAFRGGKLAGTGRWFQSMGMRPGKVHATLAAGTEMGVGVLLVLGLLTQLAAAGLIALMVVAFWTVHRDKGFMITGEGWEYVALIAVMSLVTAILGPGAMSLDYELEIAHRLDGM
ncbi:MAG: DoxX family protein, partial [Acidimicrobiaceae bacterium]|nr:DoxX family protein [Acidimicrobiaceae bacterium]